MEEEKGTLKAGEQHPASSNAVMYLNSLGLEKLLSYSEAFASCAIERNRMAEICHETLRRILSKEPISDRYLLGLAWTIRDMEEWRDE